MQKQIKDFKINYEFSKNGNKPVLIFVHGWVNNHTTWKKEYDILKEDYSVLIYDLLGHGSSEKPLERKYYTLESQSLVIDELIKKNDIKEYILIGHSLGGMITLHHEITRNKAKAIVLVDTSSLLHIRKLIDKNDKLKRIRNRLANINYSKVYTDEVPDLSKKSFSDIARFFEGLKNTPINVVLNCFDELTKVDFTDDLKKIDMPCLIIHGKKDYLIPSKDSVYLHEQIKNSKLKILEKSAHSPNVTHPEKVSNLIKKFLEKHVI